MNIDPEIVDMIAKVAVMNAAATLLMVVMAYAGSALALNGLAALDKWLDPSLKPGRSHLDGQNEQDQA